MLKKIVPLCAVLALQVTSPTAQAATDIQRIVVFGDSLSDNGNTFALTTELHQDIDEFPVVPDPELYWQGRFSNGPVWNEFFAGLVGFLPNKRQGELRQSAHYLNYAYGGAWAETYQPDDERPMQYKLGDAWHTLPPSLDSQVETYLTDITTQPDVISHDLIFIWIGGNDYLNQELTGVPIARLPEASTENVLLSLRLNLDKLVAAGAKQIVLLGLPDLGRVPNVSMHDPSHGALIPALTELSLLHNQKLLALVQHLQQTSPTVAWSYVDINRLFIQEFIDAEQRARQYQTQHAGQAQRADIPCVLTEVDPDPASLRWFARSPFLALSASQKGRMATAAPYRRCDLHNKKDQASAFNYADSYAAGGIFFDHIHPLTQVHAKIALDVCEQLFASGYRYADQNGQFTAVSCRSTSLNQLMSLIENPSFPAAAQALARR